MATKQITKLNTKGRTEPLPSSSIDAPIKEHPGDAIPETFAGADADRAARAAGGVPLSVLAQMLSARGAMLEHKGGSMPLLRFEYEGCGHVVRLLARSKPENDEDAEYSFLCFDVIDPDSFDPLRDPKGESARVMFKAQIIEGFALHSFFCGCDDSKAPLKTHKLKGSGEVWGISYHGETPTKRGQAPLKLYTVHGFAAAK